jgi:hypothetical protein
MSNPVKFRAEIMWAYLTSINPQANKYTVDLCNLNERTVEALEGMGINVLTNAKKPEKGHYITCKSTYPIPAEDESGTEIKVGVGNGSKAIVMVKPYKWEWKNKSGISPTLMKLKVTDLVEYTAGTPSDDTAVDLTNLDDDDIL